MRCSAHLVCKFSTNSMTFLSIWLWYYLGKVFFYVKFISLKNIQHFCIVFIVDHILCSFVGKEKYLTSPKPVEHGYVLSMAVGTI